MLSLQEQLRELRHLRIRSTTLDMVKIKRVASTSLLLALSTHTGRWCGSRLARSTSSTVVRRQWSRRAWLNAFEWLLRCCGLDELRVESILCLCWQHFNPQHGCWGFYTPSEIRSKNTMYHWHCITRRIVNVHSVSFVINSHILRVAMSSLASSSPHLFGFSLCVSTWVLCETSDVDSVDQKYSSPARFIIHNFFFFAHSMKCKLA